VSGTIGPDDRHLGSRMEGDLVEWLTRHESTGLARLNEFLAIPSIGTRTEHREDVVRCAGFGLPGENAHAPNEWIDLGNIRRGVRAIVRLHEELGSLSRDGSSSNGEG
jgi:acetylornithine deacetylase/succinyl-diaminopimelate desuccinylase-like protein